MNMKKVQLSKAAKIGMRNYSNVTIGCSVEWELKDGETMDFAKGWDYVNQQIDIQADNGSDPSWITKQETKGAYKTVIKTPKSDPKKEEDPSLN